MQAEVQKAIEMYTKQFNMINFLNVVYDSRHGKMSGPRSADYNFFRFLLDLFVVCFVQTTAECALALLLPSHRYELIIIIIIFILFIPIQQDYDREIQLMNEAGKTKGGQPNH